jgi:topoisomerase-4 subunit A
MRKGKQVLTVTAPDEAYRAVAAAGDMVAGVGDNHKFLVYPKAQIVEMPKGKGVRLQRYRDGGLADIKVFSAADGLEWTDSSGRRHVRTLDELREWQGSRGDAGRMAPPKFPRRNRFNASAG